MKVFWKKRISYRMKGSRLTDWSVRGAAHSYAPPTCIFYSRFPHV